MAHSSRYPSFLLSNFSLFVVLKSCTYPHHLSLPSFAVAARALARMLLDAPGLGALFLDGRRVGGRMDARLSNCAPHMWALVRGLQRREVLAGGLCCGLRALCVCPHR